MAHTGKRARTRTHARTHARTRAHAHTHTHTHTHTTLTHKSSKAAFQEHTLLLGLLHFSGHQSPGAQTLCLHYCVFSPCVSTPLLIHQGGVKENNLRFLHRQPSIFSRPGMTLTPHTLKLSLGSTNFEVGRRYLALAR